MTEGILQDLHKDHQEVSVLIERLLNTEANSQRTPLFRQMMTMLLAHSHAEQNLLYKKLEKSKYAEARKFALEGENEHQIVEQQLQHMAKARNKANEHWTAQLVVLRELVSHHVREEESAGFDCIRNEFDDEQLDKLGQQFERQKQKQMAEM